MKIKEFMDENFLLDSDVAQLLYHNYAEQISLSSGSTATITNGERCAPAVSPSA